jgi:6-phosphogluconate dehydrogenase (decarboxylating)
VKNEVRNSHLASDKAQYQIDTQFKYAKSLYLWTEKGALLHAKSLNTDKAWEVYDYLVDFYFRVKEQSQPEKKAIVPVTAKAEPVKTEYPIPKYTVVDIPENAEAQKAIQDIKKALAAIEIMVDESNRYIGKDSFLQYRRGMTDSVHALMARITRYLDVTPKLIEKQL